MWCRVVASESRTGVSVDVPAARVIKWSSQRSESSTRFLLSFEGGTVRTECVSVHREIPLPSITVMCKACPD